MANVSQWSTTAGDNNAPPPDGAPEGNAANTVNDIQRENMSAVARNFQDSKGSLITTGTGNNYLLSTNNGNLALTDIGIIAFRPDRANTGAATLDVDFLGAKAIKVGGQDVASGDIRLNMVLLVLYNESDDIFEFINEIPVASVPGVPTGAILDYGGLTVPSGYLDCNGAAVSRTVQAALFAAIGTTWGIGDGVTTFNVPNLPRRATIGSGGAGSATIGNSVGDIGGEEDHQLTVAELAAHAHPESPATVESSSGSGAAVDPGGDVGAVALSVGNAGGDAPHNTMQPSAVVLKMIKT